MTKPRLLILSFSPLVSDARLLKQIGFFAKSYDVTTCGYGSAPENTIEHLQIPDKAVHWNYARTDLILHRYKHAYWSNLAVRAARRLLGDREFDVILANDIDTIPLALDLNSVGGVHADLHEYAPREKEQILRWRMFVKPFRQWICHTFLPQCVSVTTVAAGIAEEYHREFGIDVGVAMNAAPFWDLQPQDVEGTIKLVHAGASHRDRNLEEMIDAVMEADANVSFDLYLTDLDPGYVNELRTLASPDPRIRVLDAVPADRVVPTMNAYDVGIYLLPPSNFNARWALPNKLFDFIQARLAVLIGPSPEMSAIVERSGNGIVCNDFDTRSLVRSIEALSVEDVRRWKQASHEAAAKLNADSEIEVWRKAVDEIARRAS